MSTNISPEVAQFIGQKIQSLEKLEVLLLLSATPNQWWDAVDVARALYRQTLSIEIHLQDLTADGLFSQREGETTIYQYAPDSVALNQTVRALGRAYHDKKDTVIRLIFSSPTLDSSTSTLTTLERHFCSNN